MVTPRLLRQQRRLGDTLSPKQLNQRALKLLDGLISFKEGILKHALRCEMFTANYPLPIEHSIREAKLYREYIEVPERQGDLTASCQPRASGSESLHSIAERIAM